MASKQYISIIRLLEHCGIATSDDFNLSRAKKQLHAEFGIAQSGFIEVDGYSYSRHDVFEEIEQPDFLKRLIFHRQIWNSPQILQLLEKNTINLAAVKEEFKPFWNNKKFDEFFSPCFAAPFNYISRTLLADMQLEEMSDLLAYEDFLLPADREEAFRPVSVFLEENTRLLRNVNGENYKMMRPQIAHWIDTEWHTFFNTLPFEFYDAKSYIITRLVNIGVAVQKTYRRDCRKMSEQLILLQDAPESLRSIILSNHVIYSKNTRFAIKGRPFWLIWVGLTLFRLMSQNGCNDSDQGHNSFNPNDFNHTYLMTDSSIIKTLKDSGIKVNHSDTLLSPLKFN